MPPSEPHLTPHPPPHAPFSERERQATHVQPHSEAKVERDRRGSARLVLRERGGMEEADSILLLTLSRAGCAVPDGATTLAEVAYTPSHEPCALIFVTLRSKPKPISQNPKP